MLLIPLPTAALRHCRLRSGRRGERERRRQVYCVDHNGYLVSLLPLQPPLLLSRPKRPRRRMRPPPLLALATSLLSSCGAALTTPRPSASSVSLSVDGVEERGRGGGRVSLPPLPLPPVISCFWRRWRSEVSGRTAGGGGCRRGQGRSRRYHRRRSLHRRCCGICLRCCCGCCRCCSGCRPVFPPHGRITAKRSLRNWKGAGRGGYRRRRAHGDGR